MEYELGHGKTGTLASAEHRHLLVNVLTAEEKGPEDVPQPGADIAHSHLVEGIVDRIVFIKDVLLVLGIVAESHIEAEPAMGRSSPVIYFIMVLLPSPLRPTKATFSPLSTVRSMSVKTTFGLPEPSRGG